MQKSIDLDNIILIEKKYNLPQDVRYIIESYLFDVNLFKNIWKNRLLETLSIIDKGFKLIPVYNITNNIYSRLLTHITINEYYCLECYLEAIIKKQTYVNNENCINCYEIQNIYQFTTTKYKYISYEEFKYRYELEFLKNNYIYGYKNIKIFIKSSKYLTEMILSGKSKDYQSKLEHLALLCEIKYRNYNLSK